MNDEIKDQAYEINEEAQTEQVQEAQEAQEQEVQTTTVGKTKGKSKTDCHSGDFITSVASEVEGLSKTKALNEAVRLAESIETNYFKLGGVLKLIYENSWFEGFESFGLFVLEKFGFQERKAKYLMEIYTELVDKQIPWEKVHHLGWTKLKDLARFLTPENVDEWVAKAENVTVLELQAMLKASNAPDGGDGKTKDDVTQLKFKLKSDQLETVTSALNKCKAEVSTEFDNVALEMICAGYLGGSVSAASAGGSLEDAMKAAGWEAVLEKFGEIYPKIDIQVTI